MEQTFGGMFILYFGSILSNQIKQRRAEIEELRERHGAGCECLDPESALKIQFLRLILYYCDREMLNPIDPKLFFCEEELSTNRLLLSASGKSYLTIN